jgi:hypothetical protein
MYSVCSVQMYIIRMETNPGIPISQTWEIPRRRKCRRSLAQGRSPLSQLQINSSHGHSWEFLRSRESPHLLRLPGVRTWKNRATVVRSAILDLRWILFDEVQFVESVDGLSFFVAVSRPTPRDTKSLYHLFIPRFFFPSLFSDTCVILFRR